MRFTVCQSGWLHHLPAGPAGHDDTTRTSPPRLLGFPTPQVFVKCTGYLLGEYGPLLSAAGEVPLLDQFHLLQERFVAATPETKVGAASWVGWARAAGVAGVLCSRRDEWGSYFASTHKLVLLLSASDANARCHLPMATNLLQALLLTAYEKMLVAEPDNAALREAVDALLAR